MKLFTKDIDRHLFKQYHLGSDLENQVVVAKIFNPYQNMRWFLINSDVDDPDYIWAIVQMGNNVEVGSVSRSELETIRISPFRLPLERDLGFRPVNAQELLNGLRQGKFYKKGGFVDNENKEMVENQATEVKHHSEELINALKNTDHVDAWVVGKMERATTDLSDVTHYLDGESKKMRDGGSVDYPSISERKNKSFYHLTWDDGDSVKDLVFTDKFEAEEKFDEISRNKGVVAIHLSKETFSEYGHLEKHDTYKIFPKFADGGDTDTDIYYGVVDANNKLVFQSKNEREAKQVSYSYAGSVIKKYKGKGKMADGGMIDKLVGKHIDIYTEGVKEPMTEKIISSRLTPSQYTHRDLILEIKGGGEERIPISKLDDFLNHKQIHLKDSKGEDYAISLNKKYADGGMMADGGNTNKQEWVAIFQRNKGMGNEQKVIQCFGNTKDEAIRDAMMSRPYNGITNNYELVNIYTYSGNLPMMADGGVADGGQVNKYAEVFDKLKKGDKVKMTFSSGIKKSNEKELLVVSKTIVGKGKSYESEKITFKNLENPEGVKYYAYKRKSGYVGFAMGDLAISDVQISFEDKMADGGMMADGGILYLESDGTSQRFVSDKSKATPMWIMDAEYYISSQNKSHNALIEKIDKSLPDRVGRNYIVKVKKMAKGGMSDRQETQENNFGVSYKLGDKFNLGYRVSDRPNIEVSIVEIMPSGLYFKVDKSSKLFSIKTLHSKGSTYTSGEYLVPIKSSKYSKGGMSNKKVTFDDKVKATQSILLKRKKVSPKVQKEYGKTLNKKEALQSAKRIVGAMRKKGK